MPEISNRQKLFLKQQRRRRILICFLRFFLFLLFICIWETAARFYWIDSFIFSSPTRIIRTFSSLTKDYAIYLHTGITLFETLASFFLTALIGVITAVILWLLPSIASITEPYLVVLNSLPKSALAPLLIVWLGANLRTIIVAGISVAIFGSILNLYTCFSEASAESEKLIYTLGGNRIDVLFKVVLPGTIPNLVSILKVNIGLCLVGVIIGEFIGARQGLGYLIIYGSQVYKLDWVLTAIVILCMLAVILYQLIVSIEKRF